MIDSDSALLFDSKIEPSCAKQSADSDALGGDFIGVKLNGAHIRL